MDKLVVAFYVAVYLIMTYGLKFTIILSAFLCAMFLGMSLETWSESYALLSLVLMFATIISLGKYYDIEYAKKET